MIFKSMMKIDDIGLNLLKSFEGCVLKAYKCVSTEKYYTIGYGHYGKDVDKNAVITHEEAVELLKSDLTKFERYVNELVQVPVSQSMYNALVSFCYNVGRGNFENSTLLRKLNNGDYIGANNEFARWNKSGGKVLKGLVKRRAKEQNEFLRLGIPSGSEVEKPNVKDDFVIPSLRGYKGFSIVDGLKSFGFPSSFSYREKIWKALGKTSKYKGTSKQNTALLNYLKDH